MKIDRQQQADRVYKNQLRGELLTLVEEASEASLRPCAHCTVLCPTHHSSSCTCCCSSDCDNAAQALSSEPERYPIEQGILPLVYSLSTLRVCPPCWSCEGHSRHKGQELHRIPTVWFYSRSLIYPKLIADYLVELKGLRHLHVDWHVSISYSADALDTTFAIEPRLVLNEAPELADLREDIATIAADLHDNVLLKAKAIMAE